MGARILAVANKKLVNFGIYGNWCPELALAQLENEIFDAQDKGEQFVLPSVLVLSVGKYLLALCQGNVYGAGA